MDGILDSVTEQAGDDSQQRDYYSVDTMVYMEEPDSPISMMLEYWLELKIGKQGAPWADDFQDSKLWEMKIPNRVTIIDCSAEDPSDFIIVRHAYDVTNDDWIFGDRITGQSIGAIPSQLISAAVQKDYQYGKQCPDVGTLRYARIRQHINRAHREFSRLLLPFTSENNDIIMLMAVTQRRDPAFTGTELRPDSRNTA